MTSVSTLADLHRLAFEKSLENAQAFNLCIPEHLLDQLHCRLKLKLAGIDDSTWANYEQSSKATLKAAKERNANAPSASLTFTNCDESRGRYYNFPLGPTVTLISRDETPEAVRRAVSSFGENFSMCVWGYWAQLGNKLSESDITFDAVVGKGVLHRQTGVLQGRCQITGSVELQGDSVTKVYAKGVFAKLFLHSPSSFGSSEIHWEYVEIPQKFNSELVLIPILQISDRSVFTATAQAEFEFSVIKGFEVTSWGKWLFLGASNLLLDTEKEMNFESPPITVQFCAKKAFFKPKRPPKIDISKETATTFLANASKMRQLHGYLGQTTNDFLMLEHPSFTKELDEETAAGLLNETVTSTTEAINRGLTQESELLASDVLAAWIMSVNVSSGEVEKVSTADYLIRLAPALSGLSYTHQLEVYRASAENVTAIDILQRGTDKALQQTMLKKYQLVLHNPTFPMTKGDLNNMSAFAFEELMNAKVLAAALKKGVPLEVIQGDGLGKFTNAQGVEVIVPEYVDVVIRDVGTDKFVAYQYKNAINEFNVNAQGQRVHNVDAMVDKWQSDWELKPVDSNLPKECHLENVKVVVPRGVSEDATTTRAVEEIEIGELVVPSISPEELGSFMHTNHQNLRERCEQHTEIKSIEKSIREAESKMNKLNRAKEQLQKTMAEAKNKDRHISNMEEVNKGLDELTTGLEERQNALKERQQKLNEIAKKSSWSETETERQLAKRQLKNQFKQAVILAAYISAGQELMISLVEELQLYTCGKQNFSSTALNVTKRTLTAAVIGATTGGVFPLVSYGLGRMALSQSSQVARTIGLAGGRFLGPVALAAALGYQSYHIIKAYQKGDIDKSGMAVQFTRMTGMTVGSIVCFKLAALACASTGVGLAVGAVACIVLGVADHFLFKEDSSKLLQKEFRKLREDVVEKAYAMFNLEKNCSDSELRKAYLAAIKKYHPDKNTESELLNTVNVDDRAKAVIVAYALLKSVRSTAH